MSIYMFNEKQIETLAQVIKRTGCSFRMAYAACHQTNYNLVEAIKKVAEAQEAQRMARKLARQKKQEEKEKLDKSFGPGFNDLEAFGFKD